MNRKEGRQLSGAGDHRQARQHLRRERANHVLTKSALVVVLPERPTPKQTT
jgi:hypothetical protein